MPRLTTDRLTLDEMTAGDSGFVLAMLNDPGWISNIGDRGVRTEEAAEAYIRERFLSSSWFVARNSANEPIGVCGLVQREGLAHPDIGYAFLQRWAGRGYATEAAWAVLNHALRDLGRTTILAITRPDNRASQRVLTKIGLHFVGLVNLPGQDEQSALFSTQAPVEV